MQRPFVPAAWLLLVALVLGAAALCARPLLVACGPPSVAVAASWGGLAVLHTGMPIRPWAEGGAEPLDPWGEPFYSQDSPPGGFQVRSAGPDRTFGTADDVDLDFGLSHGLTTLHVGLGFLGACFVWCALLPFFVPRRSSVRDEALLAGAWTVIPAAFMGAWVEQGGASVGSPTLLRGFLSLETLLALSVFLARTGLPRADSGEPLSG